MLFHYENYKVRLEGTGIRKDVCSHYENMPMQYIENFEVPKNENFIRNFLIFFLFLL